MQQTDIIIVGGGLAGLAAGIHLARTGFAVVIVEKNDYPGHKVCGEYLSNEIVPYLKWLGLDMAMLNLPAIRSFTFSYGSDTSLSATLPLGGIGISRYQLDYIMYQRAVEAGCKVVKDTVNNIIYNNGFTVTAQSQTFTSRLVLGAFGKWSNIDKALSRSFAFKKSLWVAVKAHYQYEVPDDEVALHSFKGGYCGVSKVEEGRVNVCYLMSSKSFKKYKNITVHEKEVLYKNNQLSNILSSGTMLFEKPLTISRISFEKKSPVENHVLMTGDSAGLIHPLCGNGMAMALHSAKIASEVCIGFLHGKISRPQLEVTYTKLWRKNFSKRLRMGRLLAKVIANPMTTSFFFMLCRRFPFLMRLLIKQTHGKVITI